MDTVSKAVTISFPRSGRGVLVRAICNAYARYQYEHGAFDTVGAHRTGMLFTHDFGMSERYPDRKVIVMVRYPLDAFASYFDMEGARDNYPDTKEEFERVVMTTWAPLWQAHVDHWVLWRPRALTAHLVVGYDRFVHSPEATLTKVEKFLGGHMDIPAALLTEPVRRRSGAFRYYQDQSLVKRITEALMPQLQQVTEAGYL